ncbi:calcium-transporting ATPase PMC1 [Sporobolomyces koalae]|uniref:calcium-transporting ATPase PMC1 n=1 Tax=Sporobolomyces koalae TaxID=500713 RepID=UPI00316B2BD1
MADSHLPPAIPSIALSPAPRAAHDEPDSPSRHSPQGTTTSSYPFLSTPTPTSPPSETSDVNPPSPSLSTEPLFPHKTSTALRDNLDPDGTRRQMERRHGRRPSHSPSFASTVADSASSDSHDDRRASTAAPIDLEKGTRSADENRRLERDAAITDTEADLHLPGQRKKFLGIPLPWTGRAKSTNDDDGAESPAASMQIVDPAPDQMGPFSREFVPSSLYNLIDPKSLSHLETLGGTSGLLEGLRTDPRTGLTDGEEGDRTRVYGENRVPSKKPKSFLQLCWAAYTDKVLIILSVAAVVSLALGLYQDLGTPPDTFPSNACPETPGVCTLPQVDWVEGVAITIAILVVVLIGSLNDWQKERQFQKLNAQKEARNVKVLRSGSEKLMSVYDVLVGDILFLEPGEIIPVDGVFLSGHNIRCDESGATGESDAVRKAPFEEIQAGGEAMKKVDPFLISGSKVLEGVGKYVVTGVGRNSFHGRIMMSLQGDAQDTPLQIKLNHLAELIAKLGSAAGLVLFAALMIRFFVGLKQDPDRSANDKAQNFIQILIISVTVVVVAVPEGLPLAVTLALAFATRRMTKMNLLVRVLGACETMANATCVCTDKTGTLTTNKMTVVAGSIGVHLKFADRLAENSKRTNANDDRDPETITNEDLSSDATADAAQTARREGRLDFPTEMHDINSHVTPALAKLLNDSIVINSTAFEGTDETGAEGGFVGSKTETALMAFGQKMGWAHYKSVRENAKIVQMIPFSSERKSMGVVVELEGGKGYRLLLKGASEVLAKASTRHVVVEENRGESNDTDESADIPTAEFTEETRSNISRTIIFYACQSLRTIALCSKDFPSWPPPGIHANDEGNVDFADLFTDLTLIAVTAIEDPLREGVAAAVATCQKAGVMVKMCTGDNVLTARSIATQCGIFSKGGIIMEGPVFRKLTQQQRLEIVQNLQVLARSSPEDKKVLVETLQSLGEVVGVTGDGTNDGPALKTANVGFSMGIAGTEVAKEASDIIVMDDNFASLVSAIMWGRCVNDAVRKFLQFQLSVNICAVVITFITAVASAEEESVLTAVQLLWVNLIMDTFAALALATDPADPESLDRKPDRKSAPLINMEMWKMIIGQAIYKTVPALVLHFAGKQILGLDAADEATRIEQTNELNTLVFNAFVFSQIFNMINCRRLDRHYNIFTRMFRNPYLLVILAIMIGGQAIIVNFGGAAFQVTRINGRDWAISIIIGLIAIPWGAFIRSIPTEPLERWAIKARIYPDPNAELPMVVSEIEEKKWSGGIQKTIDNLQTYSTIRGGRLRASSIIRKSRTRQLREANISPTHLMAMVPSLVLGSVGGGWRPEGSLNDPAAHDPSASSMHLYENGQGQMATSPRASHSRSPSMSKPLATIVQGQELQH